MSRRALSSNASSLLSLRDGNARRKQKQGASNTMRELEFEKYRTNDYTLKINYERAFIDMTLEKIKYLKNEIKKIQNRRKMNKTMSLNNPVMASMQNLHIPKIKKYIQTLNMDIERSKSNIQVLQRGTKNATEKIKTLSKKLRVQHLSMGGRKRRISKTLKKKIN